MLFRLRIVLLFLAYILSVQLAFNVNKFKAQNSLSYNTFYALNENNDASLSKVSPIVAIDQLDKELKDAFPNLSYSSSIDREVPNYESLSPDDPLFLDMPWPTERGPESTAFAKHIQWKRRLSDGERLRWQKWAVYQRIMRKDVFKYRADDYIIQQLMRNLYIQSEIYLEKNRTLESSILNAALIGLTIDDEIDIKSVVSSFYNIINHKNFDDIRTLWLPDSEVELILPGYLKSKGHFEAEKMYRKIAKDVKPFCSISSQIVSVHTYGFVSVVHTIETIEPGSALRAATKKDQVIDPKSKNNKYSPKYVLAVTVLRKFNQQWRIMSHHTAPFVMSTSKHFPGDKVEVIDTFQKRLYSTSSSSSTELSNSNSDKLVNSNGKVSTTQILSKSKLLEGVKTNDDVTTSLWKQLQVFLQDDKVKATSTPQVKKDGKIENVINVNSNSKLSSKQLTPTVDVTESVVSSSNTVLNDSDRMKASGSVTSNHLDKISTEDTTFAQRRSGSDSSSTSTVKKTVLALRFLEKTNRISRNDKNKLLLDIINSASAEENESSFENDEDDGEIKTSLLHTSLVETSFDLLVMQNFKGDRRKLMTWHPSSVDVGMDDFIEQCELLTEGEKELQEEILVSEKPPISTKKKSINISNKRIQHDQQQIFKSNKTNILPSDEV